MSKEEKLKKHLAGHPKQREAYKWLQNATWMPVGKEGYCMAAGLQPRKHKAMENLIEYLMGKEILKSQQVEAVEIDHGSSAFYHVMLSSENLQKLDSYRDVLPEERTSRHSASAFSGLSAKYDLKHTAKTWRQQQEKRKASKPVHSK